MNNPLLNPFVLPPFSKIKAEHIEPAIDQVLEQSRQHVEALLANGAPFTWERLVQPLEQIDNVLSRVWSPISHINSVKNTEQWREAYANCLPKLSAYSTEMGQNEALYKAYQSIKDSAAFQSLETAQQTLIHHVLRDFELSGVGLPDDKKQQYKEISQQLSSLTNQFEEHVMDATNAWTKLVTDENRLTGLPESTLALLKQTAEQKNEKGWMLTLEFPCYMAVMSFADDRELRREIHEAFVTRASDVGPQANQWDNAPVIDQILALRLKKAQLLGFNNYAELSLATKMASSTDEVTGFLNQLVTRSKTRAIEEVDALQQQANEMGLNGELEAWDMAYYAEKVKQAQYQFSQEDVKPYFPAQKVMSGLFAVVERLFGVRIEAVDTFDRWEETVGLFSIYDENDQLRGQFYTDLYARPHKRGGAWMDDCAGRFKTSNGLQTPVAYITCNFTPPIGDDPSLLTHQEVETLFHEFGHGLHHMLTQIDYLSVSGINGVEWDAVELPSQFLENWCWQAEVMPLISAHYQTGEPLPDALLEKMLAAKNYQSAMQMLRQLEFSLFDFTLHQNEDGSKTGQAYEVLQQVREQVSVVKTPSFNRFPNAFSHIFAGGYAAGYYSYKWAEVLSSDAFSKFEEQGVFDQATGREFLHAILEKGGSEQAIDLFKRFRGREPSIDALLRHSGIAA